MEKDTLPAYEEGEEESFLKRQLRAFQQIDECIDVLRKECRLQNKINAQQDIINKLLFAAIALNLIILIIAFSIIAT